MEQELKAKKNNSREAISSTEPSETAVVTLITDAGLARRVLTGRTHVGGHLGRVEQDPLADVSQTSHFRISVVEAVTGNSPTTAPP